MILTEAQMLPILAPLCEATQQTLQKIPVFKNDYLVVEMDEEGKKFITQARCHKPASEGDKGAFQHEGTWLVADENRSPSKAAAFWAERLPERKDLGYGRWGLAATDFAALVMHHAWPKGRIIFADEMAETLYKLLIQRFLRQSRNLDVTARFRVNGTVPELPADFIEHPDNPLIKFQRVPVVCSIGMDAYALFMEQGTGKTPTAIARVNLEAMRKRAGKIPGCKTTMYRALIVCPKQVRLNWANEFAKFSTVPGKVGVLRGSTFSRTRRMLEIVKDDPDCAWGVSIISQDSIDSSLDALSRVPWDIVIVDESHGIKNKYTLRWQSLSKLRDMHVRQRMILTGTPIANSVMDLWAQLEFLGEGMSGFQSFENYKAFYGRWKTLDDGSGNAVRKLTAIKNLPLLQERLARISFMITKDAAGLELPPKVYDIFEVEMTKKQAEWYRMIRDQLALELEGLEEKRMTAEHVLTKLLRLAQITSGFVKWDEIVEIDGSISSPSKVEQVPGENPKVAALIEMLTSKDRDPKGKTIVWACFRNDVTVIMQALEAASIKAVRYQGGMSDKERDESVQAFNTDPTCKVFVGSQATAGTGLNLLGYDPNAPDKTDTYCDHEVFFSQGWSATQRSQAEDRAHRKGTRQSVRITDLVVPGTIDEEIRVKVLQKQKNALEIQDVREILRRVLQLAPE